ncbi:MAG: hypothetical protein JXR97_02885 [Planctomycetes bacterium]|nr:hypothetical protein [Planctomycetota bacterium]
MQPGRKKRSYVTAHLTKRGKSWRIVWSLDGEVFRISIGDMSEEAANNLLSQVNGSLTGSGWEEWALKSQAVKRYLVVTKSFVKTGSIGNDDLIEKFYIHLTSNGRPEKNSREYAERIRELSRFVNGRPLESISASDAVDYLDWVRSTPGQRSGTAGILFDMIKPGMAVTIAEARDLLFAKGIIDAKTKTTYKRARHALTERKDMFEKVKRGTYRRRKTIDTTNARSSSTRNRALAICRAFYNWTSSKKITLINPFTGISKAKETKRRKIWWLARDERDAILATADELIASGDRVDAIAIWIGTWCGARRGEIRRLRPCDFIAVPGKVRIWETKTRGGKIDMETDEPRWVDLPPILHERISRHIKQFKIKKDQPIVAWSKDDLKFERQVETIVDLMRNRHTEIDHRKIGFNPFRHTFGSLLALPFYECSKCGKVADGEKCGCGGKAVMIHGAPLDYICAQLGNTSEVARRHYADLCGSQGAGYAHRLK